ncbi:MAG: hypothetical protein KIS92_26595, partial [Planctomycetota bacterium]|nr:hypothetical protein [Planctomycetota bacterium]
SIELGENVWNCQTCSTTMHQACHDTARACLNMQCPTRAQALAAQRTGTAAISGNNAAVPGAPGGNANEKPCPYCGEKILASAKKCRFCGEYLNPADRKLAEARKASSSSDDNLTGSEILFGILCGTIACIVGIVWMIQGKKKGGKLVGIAFISAFVQGLIRAMLER